jgi:hypothetical protein
MDERIALADTEQQVLMVSGIGKVHRIPPVELKCVSEKRRKEMAALVGGGTKAAPPD